MLDRRITRDDPIDRLLNRQEKHAFRGKTFREAIQESVLARAIGGDMRAVEWLSVLDGTQPDPNANLDGLDDILAELRRLYRAGGSPERQMALLREVAELFKARDLEQQIESLKGRLESG